MTFEGVLTGIVEDEAWQGNLTDEERTLCIEWAEQRMVEALNREKTYVRGMLTTLNWIMRNEPLDRADVIRAAFGI